MTKGASASPVKTHMIGKALKFIVLGLLGIGVTAFVYLLLAPPALFKVGTNYSAKIVCSNVFLAGRDADEVLAVDVQAPGHPVLGYVSANVDEEAQTVTAALLGVIAPATAQYREGLGCTNSQGDTLRDVQLPAAQAEAGGWPLESATSQSPDLDAALSNSTLLGDGYRAALVIQNGRVLAEHYADGFDAGTPLLGWSMAKTVTAAIIGTLIERGDMALDMPLTASFPDWANDGRAEITLEHMLAMSSGLQWNEGYGSVSDVTRMLYLERDMAGFAASQPLEHAPGTEFVYSSGTSTMLAKLWQDVVGDDSLTYPRAALFDPIGMQSAVMEMDAAGTYVGSSYIYASARDWARFGQFLLNGGAWDGTQILPDGFTEWMFEKVAVSDDRYAKGHLWHESHGRQPPFEDAVWLLGHDGQSVAIVPSRNLIVVRMGLTPSRTGYSARPLLEAVVAALPK